MLPYITLFGKAVPTYSIAAGFGILFAALYLKGQKGSAVPNADVELAFVYALVGAATGAKLLWLMTCRKELIAEWRYFFTEHDLFLQKYLYSGFVFYGGLFGCILAVLFYSKLCHLDVGIMMQTLLPALPIIHSFGRIGCFCVGCCYGKHLPRACVTITYSISEIAPNGIALVPVQLYEAFAEFVLFLILAFMSHREKSGRAMLAFYLLTYGAVRFALEFLRGDSYRGFIGTFSVSQVLSLFSFALGTLLLFLARVNQGFLPSDDR